MSIQRIDTKPTYSEIVINNNVVYLSGQVAQEYAKSDFKSQAREVFALIDFQLQRVGSNKTKILNLQIFLTDPANYGDMNNVFLEWMPEGKAPARNTICGVRFPNPNWKIEVVVTAAI
jgi:enamine deaminase RidA (YjgF/YER057c/UK114 family)